MAGWLDAAVLNDDDGQTYVDHIAALAIPNSLPDLPGCHPSKDSSPVAVDAAEVAGQVTEEPVPGYRLPDGSIFTVG